MHLEPLNRLGTRLKAPETLAAQLVRAEQMLGEPLHCTLSKDASESLSFASLKQQLAVRISLYRDALTQLKAGSESSPTLMERIANGVRSLKMLNGLARRLDAHDDGTDLTFRAHQLPVFQAIRSFLEGGRRKGYITLPTGTGKTVIFSEVIEALGAKSLVVVPSIPLLEQTIKEFGEFAPKLDVGCFGGGKKTFGKDVTVITYDSFRELELNGTIADQGFELIVLDEAHKALGDESAKSVKRLLEKHLVLGFTATPEYSAEKSLKDLLETEVYRLETREAIEIGALCETRVVAVRSKVGLKDVSLSAGDYNQTELGQALNETPQNRLVVDTYLSYFQGKKSLAFCAGVDHAEALAQTFIASGVIAEHISGRDSPEEQKRKIEAYKKGEIKVLCNADLLIHGFDDKEVSVVLNCTPTMSRLNAQQRAGRALRLDPNDPNKIAYIVEFIFEDRPRSRTPVTFNHILNGTYVHPIRHAAPRIRIEQSVDESAPVIKAEPAPVPPLVPTKTGPVVELVSVPYEVEELLRISQLQYNPRPPTGWITTQDLVLQVGLPYRVVRPFVREKLFKHPEWAAYYTYEGSIPELKDKVIEHIHPELVAQLINEIVDATTIPAGWRTASSISDEVGVSVQVLRTNFIGPAQALAPSQVVRFSGKRENYLSPALVADILGQIARARGPIEEGWKGRAELRKTFALGADEFDRLVAQYLIDNPHWFRWYVTQGLFREYYSPELVQQLTDTVERWKKEEQEYPFRQGWSSVKSLYKLGYREEIDTLSLENRIMAASIKEHAITDPNEFSLYKRRGHTSQIVSQVLASRLRHTVGYRLALADGWQRVELVQNLLENDEQRSLFAAYLREAEKRTFMLPAGVIEMISSTSLSRFFEHLYPYLKESSL